MREIFVRVVNQQRKVAETWDTLIKHFRGRNILGKIGRTVRRREIGYRVGIRSQVWHYIRVRHVGEKISTVEKCENYWYCRDHISLSEDIDVALARTSRLRIYLFPILTRSASWEHGPIGERRSDTEGRDAPSQRKGYQVPTGLIYSSNIFRSSRATEIYTAERHRGIQPPDRELLSSERF